MNEEQILVQMRNAVLLTCTRMIRPDFRNPYTNRNHNRMFGFPQRSTPFSSCDGSPIFSLAPPPVLKGGLMGIMALPP